MFQSTHTNTAGDSLAQPLPVDLCVDMGDAWQVLLLCRELGLTKSQLEATIGAAGNRISDIQQYLRVGMLPESDLSSGNTVVPINAIRRMLSKASV